MEIRITYIQFSDSEGEIDVVNKDVGHVSGGIVEGSAGEDNERREGNPPFYFVPILNPSQSNFLFFSLIPTFVNEI